MKSNYDLISNNIRKNIIRMINKGNSSHVGSALSCVDLLVSIYSDYLKFDTSNPDWNERDIFILSKGHAGSAVYATLSEFGFFSEEKLLTHYQNGSDLSGHVSHKNVPGVEFSTGSLGHGLPVATGNALALKKQNSNRKVCVLLSDGECDEGSNWEAAMFASHHELNNLLCIIDYNKLQSLTTTQETLALEPFNDKWKAFGWDVREVDGHNHESILSTINKPSNKPICVIAHTTKGKGVSFMENSVLWHYRSPQGEEFENALKELELEK
jgi:transketolase